MLGRRGGRRSVHLVEQIGSCNGFCQQSTVKLFEENVHNVCEFDSNSTQPAAEKKKKDKVVDTITRRRSLMQARNIARKETLMNEEERHDALDDPHDYAVELAKLSPGEYFGEISTFIEVPRTAKVTASSIVLLLSISKTSFRSIYHSISPHLEVDIETVCKQHMLHTLLQSKSPFLEDMDILLMKQMGALARIESLEKDVIVFHEGESAQSGSFYFVYSGSVCVQKEQCTPNETIGTLGSGEYFGELALIDSTGKRRATISAKTKTLLLAITREDFDKCLQRAPQLLAELRVRTQGANAGLQILLEHKKTRVEFEVWLVSTGSIHILTCYEYTKKYKECAIPDEQNAMLITFLETYTKKESSPQFIEFTNQRVVTLELETAFMQRSRTQEEGRPDALNPFQKIVCKILECDILPAFKKSSSWISWSSSLRVYDDIDQNVMS